MELAILIVFIAGYIAIVAEHPLKLDKAATALITGVLCWAIYFVGSHQVQPTGGTEMRVKEIEIE